jgi:aminomethyltransferase
MTTTKSLARTPLFELALEQKARMTGFSGWEMPVQFVGLKQEHQAVRNSVGMFDISHMGKFGLAGGGVRNYFQALVPSNLDRLQPGEAQYTVLLNEQGGIIDDIIFYHQSDTEAFVIVNAATRTKDKKWIEEHLAQTGVTLTDLSLDKVLIAVQGVEAQGKLQPMVLEDLSKLKAFDHTQVTILDTPGFIARTGYTGEDGFEVMVDPLIGVEVWRSLLKAGVTPCGLGSRDTLRLEAALSLYGQDIDETTTPLEAGLGWLVHWEKGDFIGRSVLEKQKEEGVQRRLVGLQMQGRHIARHGYPVLVNGEKVGEITSGTYSPTLEGAIALAYVPPYLAKPGQLLDVEIRGKIYPAEVVKKPFYRSPHR